MGGADSIHLHGVFPRVIASPVCAPGARASAAASSAGTREDAEALGRRCRANSRRRPRVSCCVRGSRAACRRASAPAFMLRLLLLLLPDDAARLVAVLPRNIHQAVVRLPLGQGCIRRRIRARKCRVGGQYLVALRLRVSSHRPCCRLAVRAEKYHNMGNVALEEEMEEGLERGLVGLIICGSNYKIEAALHCLSQPSGPLARWGRRDVLQEQKRLRGLSVQQGSMQRPVRDERGASETLSELSRGSETESAADHSPPEYCLSCPQTVALARSHLGLGHTVACTG